VAILAADKCTAPGGKVAPPLGGGFIDPSVSGALTGILDDWLNANDCGTPVPE